MSTVFPSSDQQLDRAALAALYEETFKNLEEGTITEGRIVAVTKDKVVVDIGYKSEGMIPNDQFSTEELQNIKVGDRLQVYIEECEDADGNLVLSKEKADKMKIWEELELPKLRPQMPWFGYSLGQWSDELDQEAELAVQGRHFETGEKLKKARVKVR
jgi:transcriptional accessory protein Tex/SPT6